jgi:hypothetical protein
MTLRWVLAFGLVLGPGLGACKREDAPARSKRVADSTEFWPEAPKPSSTAGQRTLAYNPENIRGYAMDIDVGSAPGADLEISAKMGIRFAFQDGGAPRARAALLRDLHAEIKAAGQQIIMRVNGDEVYLKQDGREATRIKRGEEGRLSVADLVDKPFTTLTFTEASTVEMAPNQDHPFTTLGGDMLDTALVLFPNLPAGPISPGHKWSVTRNVPIGNHLGRVDVIYQFQYTGDGACPSGGAACSQLVFTASSADAVVRTGGTEVKVTYGFAGKVYFDTAKGIIDESRVRMDMDVRAEKMAIPMTGTFTVRPAT